MRGAAPPFRADHVGSLLRPARLKEARRRRAAGEIGPEQLAEIEDREIEILIRRQEDIGLRSITDGEFRRKSWQTDFVSALPGIEIVPHRRNVHFQGGAQPQQVLPRVTRKLGDSGDAAGHPMIEHFRFVAARTRRTPKVTIPSPSALHFRDGRDAVPTAVYPDIEEFYRDLGETYRRAVNGFVAAGCRYLQFDEVNLTYLCDPKLVQQVRERGDDPAALARAYAGMINAAIADIPADMTITMHLCRGNFRSNFIASGGYEPVAELMFNGIGVHGYFMEYDTDRAGSFEVLRLLPKGKRVVLGLVTSKRGELETKDAIKRRIEEAACHAPLDQLCLSPQCGFASSEEGNILAEDEQWAKLRMIVEIAAEVWGS